MIVEIIKLHFCIQDQLRQINIKKEESSLSQGTFETATEADNNIDNVFCVSELDLFFFLFCCCGIFCQKLGYVFSSYWDVIVL